LQNSRTSASSRPTHAHGIYRLKDLILNHSMLRSLPPISRALPAAILILTTTCLLFIAFSRFNHPSTSPRHLSPECDIDGHCNPDELLLKPPSRQELHALEQKINNLEDELEKLKGQDLPKQVSEEEKLWESRRTQCGEGVVRNIDYQHVLPSPNPQIE